jgi:3-oxoadipate enol-lactonase
VPYINCNNVSLFYLDEGAGEDTIVFSHGLLFSHEMFRAQIDVLKSKFRCIAYDHRGQGKSEVTQSGYDMDTLFLDAAALIQNLQLEKVHFVGLSMGGFVGMRLAARKPHLLKSLTLLETSADEEVFKFKYKLLNSVVRFAGTKPVHKKVMSILFGATFLKNVQREHEVTRWKNHLLSQPRTIVKAVHGVIFRKSIFNEIAAIHTPTLIIVGDEDVATTPEKALRIQKQINGSVLEIVKQAGHSSAIEQPLRITELIENFILNCDPKTQAQLSRLAD